MYHYLRLYTMYHYLNLSTKELEKKKKKMVPSLFLWLLLSYFGLNLLVSFPWINLYHEQYNTLLNIKPDLN